MCRWMTKVEFSKEKMLLKRGDLVRVGVPAKAIAELTRSGRLTCIVLHLGGCRYYHKSSVAKLLGLEC